MSDFKVIFIGSVSYSGSTMLDLILSNTHNSFSCGELVALVRPWRNHHLSNDNFWKSVINEDSMSIYERIAKNNTSKVELIIDSSKDPFWIRDQMEILDEKGIEYFNILLWKSPSEIYDSFMKRGRGKLWKRSWVNYHRLYFTLIDNFMNISYEEMVKTDSKLEVIFSHLSRNYSSKYKFFWNREKKDSTLFGNTNTKYHLDNPESINYTTKKEELEENNISGSQELLENMDTLHKKIYYNEPSNIINFENMQNVVEIHNFLLGLDTNSNSLKFSKTSLKIRRLNYNLSKILGKYLYRFN